MLVGFGMLVFASVTGTVAWAWLSVASSVVAAGVLISSWRARSATLQDDRAATDHRAASCEPPAGDFQPAESRPPESHPSASQPSATQPVADSHAVDPQSAGGSERADPAVAAVVAILDRQVFVVDEQPDYHLSGCPALSGRRSVGVSVREAVELDFTPCTVCTPVRVLAAAASDLRESSGNRSS